MDRRGHYNEGAIATGPVHMRPVAYDADEPEAIEDPTANADYGSLIGRGPRKFKKKPVLVLDPAEAETGARLIQHLAKQQWADGGKCGEPAGCVMLHPEELEASIADFVAGVELDPDEGEVPLANSLAGTEESDEDDPVIPASEAVFETAAVTQEALTDAVLPEPVAEVLEEPAQQFDVTGPAAIEEAAVPDPHCETAAVAQPSELPAREEPSSSEPDIGVHGHALRARVVQEPQPHKTLRDRIAIFLRAISNWVKRNWQ